MIWKGTLSIALWLICGIAAAQTPPPAQPGKDVIVHICTPSRAQVLGHDPLYVIFANDKLVFKSNKATESPIAKVNPNDIKAINVLKDSSAVKHYGAIAQYGVVEIYLKPGAVFDTTKVKVDTVRKRIRG